MAIGGYPPSPKFFSVPMGPTTTHFITTAAALRLGNFLSHHVRRRLLLSSSLFESTSHLGCFYYMRNRWKVEALHHLGFTTFQLSYGAISATLANLYFSQGNGNRNESRDTGKDYSKASKRNLFDGRNWTNMLIAANVLIYVVQNVTNGRLLYWGAKINSLIDKGQLWRLVTSSFLHANIGHLLVNCYSLNSVGPAIENICGPRRFLAVYISSAVAGCGMSYWLTKAPAVGASGAISGLVGSLAVFTLRHKGLFKGGEQDLQHILRVIALNMVMGVALKGIDNWGHLGGLIGGAAVSWLLGPAWKLESVSDKGHKVLVDKAPIFTITKNIRTTRYI